MAKRQLSSDPVLSEQCNYPDLRLWLDVVGFSVPQINSLATCSHVESKLLQFDFETYLNATDLLNENKLSYQLLNEHLLRCGAVSSDMIRTLFSAFECIRRAVAIESNSPSTPTPGVQTRPPVFAASDQQNTQLSWTLSLLGNKNPGDLVSCASLPEGQLSVPASLSQSSGLPFVQRPANSSATLPKCAGKLAHRVPLPFSDSSHSLNHLDPRLTESPVMWAALHPKTSTGSVHSEMLHDVHSAMPMSPLASPIDFAHRYESFLPPAAAPGGSSQLPSHLFLQHSQPESSRTHITLSSAPSHHAGAGTVAFPSSAPASASVTPDMSRRSSVTNASANIFYPENYPDMPSSHSHAFDAELTSHRDKRSGGAGGESIAARLIGLITPRATRRQFHAHSASTSSSQHSISASRSAQQLPLELKPSPVRKPFAGAGAGAGAGDSTGDSTGALSAVSAAASPALMDAKRLAQAEMIARLSHSNPSAPQLLARHPAPSKFYDASTLPHRYCMNCRCRLVAH